MRASSIAEHVGQQSNGALDVFGVLAHDRDAVGVPVLDQHAAVAVEHQAARRPQRQRPLVIVLRHLGEFRVLDDLEAPRS